jgi:glycosyltransferase involved in cell wall biosynthesis
MRVLVATSHSDRSETWMYRRLRSMGVDLEVLCDPDSNAAGELRADGVPVHALTFHSRLDWHAARAIRTLLRDGAFDIVHAFNKRALSHAMLASRRLPVQVMTYRGVIGNLSRWNPEARWTFFNPRLAGIVCVCHAVREHLAGIGISPDKLRTIHKGHDPAWYRPAPRAELTRLGIPPDAFVAGCAGRMRARKGLTALLDAVAQLPKNTVHLLLVGALADPEAERKIRRHGLQDVVHTPGFRRDAPALMGACDIFVMPSLRREGLPRAVIEAMAQGTPALVTHVGGMPEIVRDGIEGRVVEPGNVTALAEAIRYMRENPARRRAFGEKAAERIRTAFRIEDTVAQTEKFYQEVLRLPVPDADMPSAARE